ncbi:MAG: hypothetical protein FJX76_06090 [Armatimonadetes bacterium]|nr:hypothetical protein [Armatimonadota bacterium]
MVIGSALLVALAATASWAGERAPFDPSWQSVVLIWDYQKNPLTCHGEPARLVGEEKTRIQVGSDAQGKPVLSDFRLLTYRCDDTNHPIKVWLVSDMNMVREVSCHAAGNVARSKGFDKDAEGHVVQCKDGHKIIFKGAAKDL